MMKILAPAKINLTLEVLSRRHDGYHEISSVVQTVGLYDELVFEPAVELSVVCSGLDVAAEDNLVIKAARLLGRQAGVHPGATISLRKGIPAASGLGGGSSDAAAALMALNDIWQLGLTLEKLGELGAGIGSDVPFFILGGHTALVTGRGEVVSPIGHVEPAWVVLLRPEIDMSADKTRKMYESLTRANFTAGQRTAKMIDGIRRERRIHENLLFNVFEEVASGLFPELLSYWRAMKDAGNVKVNLAGSGPTLYSLFHQQREAASAFDALKSRGNTVYLVSTLE